MTNDPILDYAAPPPEREADARRIFFYLVPGALCIAAILGSVIIERTFPQGDSRNFQGPCLAVVMGPIGLILLPIAIREAFRPNGVRVLRRALGWSLLLALGPWLVLWIIIRFQLLRHV